MVAEGFYQPVCFNPALVYLVAGLLIGLSLRFYMDRYRKPGVPTPSRKKRR
jgi:hypothetical protein